MSHSTSSAQAAGEALATAVKRALAGVASLNGCYDGAPLRAAFPYATVDAGLESDWGHKSGAGREVKLAVTLRDSAERPARLRSIAAEAEAALSALGGSAEGWRIVSFAFLRSRLLPESERRWAAVLDYRARMLSD